MEQQVHIHTPIYSSRFTSDKKKNIKRVKINKYIAKANSVIAFVSNFYRFFPSNVLNYLGVQENFESINLLGSEKETVNKIESDKKSKLRQFKTSHK